MDQRPAVIRLAVFGSPIRQSRSPAIHSLFAQQCGLDVDYQAIEATVENFAGLVRALAARGGLGCNITAPFKQQAWQLAQRDSSSARRARAANTLVFESADDWYADNTDGRGLVQDLSANLGRQIRASRICIIGAGGAAAGILGDLLAQEPDSITIANRTVERARELQRTFNTDPTAPAVSAISLDDLGSAAAFDLVINATSLGHQTRHPGLPESIFKLTACAMTSTTARRLNRYRFFAAKRVSASRTGSACWWNRPPCPSSYGLTTNLKPPPFSRR